MSYPTISPCAIAPVLHAASKRRTQLTSSPPHLQDSHAEAHWELGVSGRHGSTSTRNMLELQPVNGSDGTLSNVIPSTESYSYPQQHSFTDVRNYEHLVLSSPPPASTGDYIIFDHNGNNENWHRGNVENLCSTESLGEDYRCNTCRRQQEISHLCMSTSLPWNVTGGHHQGDSTPTFYSTIETGLGDMAEVDQDIRVFSRLGILNEDELFDQELYTPRDNISTSHNQNPLNRNEEKDDVHLTADRDSCETWTISSTETSSVEMSPRILSDTDTQPARGMPPGLVEVGRCSIYFDTKTRKYHSTMFGSFPRDAPGRHRLGSHPSENLAFFSRESTQGSSLPNMSTYQYSSRRNGATGTKRCGCVTVEGRCIDGSAVVCSQCAHGFHVCVSDHVTALSHQLSVPGGQSLGKDCDCEQMVHTYPGTMAYKSEETVKPRTQVRSCVYRDMKGIHAPAGCADKHGTDVHRCPIRVPSHFVSENDPTITQANNFPTYSLFPSSPTHTNGEVTETGNGGQPLACSVSHTKVPYPQGRDDRGQNNSKLSTKQNKTTFSLSSFFGNMFSGKTRDKLQTNEKGCERKEHDLNNGSQFETQRRLRLTPDFCRRDLSDQPPAGNIQHSPHASNGDVCEDSNIQHSPHESNGDVCEDNNRQHSPHESNGDDCGDNNSLSGVAKQTDSNSMGNPAETDLESDNSEEKKRKLRIFREMTRNYAAYLCCPPDALITFGLPFHRLLESWGLPIFIPERNLPLGGAEYENMAHCVEESCNGKVIVILSNTYANSEQCMFLTYFAKTLDPDSRHRNIIPVLIDSDVQIPNVLKGLSLIKYNHLVRSGWLKEKLVRAIAA